MAAFLVIGGAGRTGDHVVRRLLDRGDEPRVMSRRPRRPRRGVPAVIGDIADADAVAQAVDGVDGVVVSIEPPTDDAGADRVLHRGVALVADRAAELGVPLVLVSQIYVTRPEAMPGMAGVVAARSRGEQAVRAAGGPYTIIRPSWLHDGPAGGVHLDQGDRGDGRIARATVAEVCVAALVHPEANGRTMELYDAPEVDPPDWPARFAVLARDRAAHHGRPA